MPVGVRTIDSACECSSRCLCHRCFPIDPRQTAAFGHRSTNSAVDRWPRSSRVRDSLAWTRARARWDASRTRGRGRPPVSAYARGRVVGSWVGQLGDELGGPTGLSFPSDRRDVDVLGRLRRPAVEIEVGDSIFRAKAAVDMEREIMACFLRACACSRRDRGRRPAGSPRCARKRASPSSRASR